MPKFFWKPDKKGTPIMTLSRRALLAGLAATPLLPSLAAARDTSRLVSVGGSVTETVYFLSQDSRLIGADTTSLYPAAAFDLPKVGYMRNLSVEGVLSLDPSLMLAVEGSGPPNALDSLRAAGLDLVMVPEARDIDGVVRKIELVADVLGVPDKGDTLIRDVEIRAKTVSDAVSGLTKTPRVLFLLDFREGSLMAAGRGTAAEAIIALAGGQLVFDEFYGYKPISTESALGADCDVILMMDQTVERLGGPTAVLELGPLQPLRAAQEGRLISMDGLLMLGFGPRTPDAMVELAGRLHGPDALSVDLPALTPA